jgi:hypothetical protein
MTSMERLLAEALVPPENERARLAHELLLSLDEERTENTEQLIAAWTAELANRLQDVREGKVELIDVDR